MIKKVILGLFLIFSVIGNVSAEGEREALEQAKKDYQLQQLQDQLNAAKKSLDEGPGDQIIFDENYDMAAEIGKNMQTIADTQKAIDQLKADGAKEGGSNEKLDEAQNNYDESEEAHGDISSRGFEIKVDTFSPGIKIGDKGLKNTSEVINYTLGTIIQKLMVALGVLAVLIMTVGAGYIIMYHGQDELLSKGKSIFMAGVTSLVVALSSYYLVSILRFILYN